MDTLGRTRVPKTGEIAPTLDREDRYSGAVGPTSLQSAVRRRGPAPSLGGWPSSSPRPCERVGVEHESKIEPSLPELRASVMSAAHGRSGASGTKLRLTTSAA